jgi:hypothetical protein
VLEDITGKGIKPNMTTVKCSAQYNRPESIDVLVRTL